MPSSKRKSRKTKNKPKKLKPENNFVNSAQNKFFSATIGICFYIIVIQQILFSGKRSTHISEVRNNLVDNRTQNYNIEYKDVNSLEGLRSSRRQNVEFDVKRDVQKSASLQSEMNFEIVEDDKNSLRNINSVTDETNTIPNPYQSFVRDPIRFISQRRASGTWKASKDQQAELYLAAILRRRKLDSFISSLPKNKGWIIIGFANFEYLLPAKIWYNQLASLGYTEHAIVALDSKTYEILKNDEKYRVLPAPESGRYLDQPVLGEDYTGSMFLKTIWSIRFEKTRDLLREGYNVFLTDIDSIWMKYVSLESLTNFDVSHAACGNWPQAAFDEWGFVVCAGVTAYRSNQKTIELLDYLYFRCEFGCDDQIVLNHKAYQHDLKIKWEKDIKWHHNIPENQRMLLPKHTGKTSRWIELDVMVFSDDTILREKMESAESMNRCELVKSSWIVSPNVPKTQEGKLKMYNSFRECLGNDEIFERSGVRRVVSLTENKVFFEAV